MKEAFIMNIIDIKNKLYDKSVLTILSYSVYKPTKNRLNDLADKYGSDTHIFAFAYKNNGLILGIIILHHITNDKVKVVNIATTPAHRRQGIASRLITFTADKLKYRIIEVETDADAVDFYRRYGFQVNSLGEKYPNCTRYLCTFKTR